MSYRTSIASSESENEHFEDPADIKMKPSASKSKQSLKRGAEMNTEKTLKKGRQATSSSSYRDNVGDLFRLEDYEEEVTSH
ncbi:uncharacterized protein LOC111036739 [Myzus persicae]|uniref:uncharacterized protein LOC111036739 n=1 Tax=Myzus persicae TaxID=13164 RepID=UPI000B937C91|nr:uncharacterized protein LOC111036739 [Myzus persicae]